MKRRVGVVIIGVNGAVASTVIAGTELMARGLVPANRHGHREGRCTLERVVMVNLASTERSSRWRPSTRASRLRGGLDANDAR
jgi:hypothetical protein